MYVPKLYQADLSVQHLLIESHPFAVMIDQAGGRSRGVHLPFVLDRLRGPLGTLSAHLALANEMAPDLGKDVMVVFSGPHSYVSPDWYEGEGQFPTWIYSAVHAYGQTRVLAGDELTHQLETLIAREESRLEGKQPWKLSRARPEFVEHLRKMIVGFEITIEHIEGCFKLNQHKKEGDLSRMLAVLEASPIGLRRELADDVRDGLARRGTSRPPLGFENV